MRIIAFIVAVLSTAVAGVMAYATFTNPYNDVTRGVSGMIMVGSGFIAVMAWLAFVLLRGRGLPWDDRYPAPLPNDEWR